MKWYEDPKWEMISRKDLLNICLNFRMSLNGSADPLSIEEETKIVNYIKIRLQQWGPSKFSAEEKIDEIIKQLCYATLELFIDYNNKRNLNEYAN